VSFTTVDVTAKRLGLLHELVPQATVIAALLDPNLLEGDLELLQASGRLRPFAWWDARAQAQAVPRPPQSR
jgi:hypothetical protein